MGTMSHRSEVRKAELRVIHAASHLGLEPTDDGMAECKWDQYIILQDALTALDELGLVEPGKARHTRGAPLTSQMAYRWMNGAQAKSLAGEIVVYTWRHRLATGVTVPDLIVVTSRPHQSVSARVNELRDLGWFVDSGRTRIGPSGAEATVWILSETAQHLVSEANRENIITKLLTDG